MVVLAIPLAVAAAAVSHALPAGEQWREFAVAWMVFLLGAVLFSNERTMAAVRRDWAWFLVAGVLVLAVYLGAVWLDWHEAEGTLQYAATRVGLTFIAWCLPLSLLGFGMRYLDVPNRLITYAMGVIIPFYVIHYPIVVAIAYVVVRWDLNLRSAHHDVFGLEQLEGLRVALAHEVRGPCGDLHVRRLALGQVVVDTLPHVGTPVLGRPTVHGERLIPLEQVVVGRIAVQIHRTGHRRRIIEERAVAANLAIERPYLLLVGDPIRIVDRQTVGQQRQRLGRQCVRGRKHRENPCGDDDDTQAALHPPPLVGEPIDAATCEQADRDEDQQGMP